MSTRPSPYRYALTEPAHLGAFAVLFVVLLIVGVPFLPIVGILALVEALYLLGFARSSAYARRVQLKEVAAKARRREAALEQRASSLRRDERRRFREIDKLHDEVVVALDKAAENPDTPHELRREDLDRLKEAALDFCVAMQTFRENLKKAPLDELRQELVDLDMASGGDARALEARKQTRELLTKRIAHLSSLEEQLTSLDGQVEVIEQTFRLMKEQVGTLGAPGELRTDVGALVREVEATRETVRELGAYQVEGVVRTL